METAEAHLAAAEAALKQNHAKAALDEAKAALRIQPGSGRAHALMGLAYVLMGEEADARDEFAQAPELSPLDSQVRYLAYLGYMRLKDSLQARTQLTYFVDLEPKNAQAKAFLTQLGGAVEDLPPLPIPQAVHWYDAGGHALTDAGDLEDEREDAEPPPGPGVIKCPECEKRTFKGICCKWCGAHLPLPVPGHA